VSQPFQELHIVISEETGEMSVAMEGGLQKGLDMDALRELLNTLFAKRT